ncbi:substrate-binding domain-containing protein [Saccharothrix syringae]|uniref:Guanylate cyclase domain-containing protein n=1 Tax=Saccharothrix syringae TaxID=103733 RepID=A0A5Q0GV64_SACSY|nr:substrate-binding domain-containing protein [Saccharothrix syringae]QFZ17370.1 hypothetical protein EKG83_07690 [Saccharothrix syringae]
MGTPHHAMHRTVLVVDVSGFSLRRSNHQEEIRRGLYDALEGAFDECGLDWSETHHEDRGDGVLVLIPPSVPKGRVVGALRHALAGELLRYNARRAEDARVRLRIAVTAGEVRHDAHGVVGDEVTLAFRLLDSAPLREAVDRTTGVLALIVSRRFFEDVVRDDPAAEPDAYERVEVRVKQFRDQAWVHVPGGHATRLHLVRSPRSRPPPAEGHRPPRHRRGRRKPPLALLLPPVLLLAGFTAADAPVPPPPCPDPLQLNVVASTEKRSVVADLALEFERASRGFTPHGCKGVSVLVFAGGTDEVVAKALGEGWPAWAVREIGAEPHVWLPDTSLEVDGVDRDLADRRVPGLRLTRSGHVAQSPVVLAASAEQAERIGNDREFAWPVGRLAEVDASSGTGLAAVITLVHGRLDALRLDSPLELHRVARETGGGAPCRGEAAVLTSERAASLDDSCRILYPEGGTVVLDHPFVEVERSAPVNPRRREAVRRFREHLLSIAGQDALRRAGYRDAEGNTGLRGEPRAGRPEELPTQPDARQVRRAWRGAALPKRIALAAEGAEAAAFAALLRAELGPRDAVLEVPATGPAVEEAVRLGADVVVLLGGRPSGPGAASRLRAVGVGFGAGACDRGTPLESVVEANSGVCHPVVGAEGAQLALEGVAKAIWGG